MQFPTHLPSGLRHQPSPVFQFRNHHSHPRRPGKLKSHEHLSGKYLYLSTSFPPPTPRPPLDSRIGHSWQQQPSPRPDSPRKDGMQQYPATVRKSVQPRQYADAPNQPTGLISNHSLVRKHPARVPLQAYTTLGQSWPRPFQ